MRADLSRGAQVAQAIHAAGESAAARVPKNTIAVALAARDRDHLLELDEQLERAGVAHVLIRECDGEPMAIGCEPTRDRAAIRKELSRLPLVR